MSTSTPPTARPRKPPEWVDALPTAPFIRPRFSSPRVAALMSTRSGGVSAPPWHSLNVGLHVGDAPERVEENRRRVSAALGMPLVFLTQVHGTRVLAAGPGHVHGDPAEADAAWTQTPGVGLTVQVADCLPVLIATPSDAPRGAAVGAAHAGWRGLCHGVVEATVAALCEASGASPSGLEVWLGPCIGPQAFEVGAEVLETFAARDGAARSAFRPGRHPGKWWADLHVLARQRLSALGVTHVHADTACTVSESSRFFSFRRDGVTGRMVGAIGLRD